MPIRTGRRVTELEMAWAEHVSDQPLRLSFHEAGHAVVGTAVRLKVVEALVIAGEDTDLTLGGSSAVYRIAGGAPLQVTSCTIGSTNFCGDVVSIDPYDITISTICTSHRRPGRSCSQNPRATPGASPPDADFHPPHVGRSRSTIMASRFDSCPVITSSKLAAARVGRRYKSVLSATGGAQGYRWSITSGHLPVGLRLSSTGVITGTPKGSGVYTVVLRVLDAHSHAASRRLTLQVTANR